MEDLNRVDNHLVDHSTAFEYAETCRDRNAGRLYGLTTYDKDAVLKYRASSIEDLLDDTRQLYTMIKHHHTRQVPRLDALEAYYLANNPVIMHGQRRTEEGKADHRARHAFAAIIADTLNVFSLGNPVKIEDATPTGDNAFMQIIDAFGRANAINEHNLSIGLDQSVFGRAYEMLQRTEDDDDRIYRLDPRETFLIYDTTVRTRVIGACRYVRMSKERSSSAPQYAIELYDYTHIYSFAPRAINNAKTGKLTLVDVTEHSFYGVPIIEYRSDRYMLASFERQLPLIDLYDAAQSDTANYMTDFNDAILAIKGRLARDVEDNLAKFLDANILLLIGDEAIDGRENAVSAEYLTKSYDVQGVESYKDRIKTDIFTQSATPDLSDSNFSGTQSGEALKYKLFGLQQRREEKEKSLAKGFKVRYRLLENLYKSTRQYTGESPDIMFTFTPNLPQALMEELKAFVEAGGELSQETMLGLLSFIESPKDELELLKQEKEADPVDALGFGRYGHENEEALSGYNMDQREDSTPAR